MPKSCLPLGKESFDTRFTKGERARPFLCPTRQSTKRSVLMLYNNVPHCHWMNFSSDDDDEEEDDYFDDEDVLQNSFGSFQGVDALDDTNNTENADTSNEPSESLHLLDIFPTEKDEDDFQNVVTPVVPKQEDEQVEVQEEEKKKKRGGLYGLFVAAGVLASAGVAASRLTKKLGENNDEDDFAGAIHLIDHTSPSHVAPPPTQGNKNSGQLQNSSNLQGSTTIGSSSSGSNLAAFVPV